MIFLSFSEPHRQVQPESLPSTARKGRQAGADFMETHSGLACGWQAELCCLHRQDRRISLAIFFFSAEYPGSPWFTMLSA
jgi:hypothetical protein